MKSLIILSFIMLSSSYGKDLLGKSPSKKEQREFYSKIEQLNEKKQIKKNLESILRSYHKLFKVNPSHFHLEPFIPFYLKNEKLVKETCLKVGSKKECEEFDFRMGVAKREYSFGQDDK